MKNKRKNGFSMTETVIALAIITIVTAAALSVIMASISARLKATNYSAAQDFAHNIIECFKAADDETDFASNVSFAAINAENGFDISNAPNTYKNNRFTANITMDGGFDVGGNITIGIDVNNDNSEDLSFTYTKGAK